MTTAKHKTPLEMLYQWEQKQPDTVFLRQPINRQYKDFTWAEVADQSRRIANGLRQMDIEPGSTIAILSKNCAEWFITDFALMMGGYISVPIFATANADTISYVLNHSEAKAVFVGKLDDWSKQQDAIPESLPRIAFPYPTMPAKIQWQELLKSEPLAEPHQPSLDELMTIIYTSGSTGDPKGVMHNYSSFAWASETIVKDISITPADRTISYLPLAHITERTYIEGAALYGGVTTAFTESLETFIEDVQRAEPTLFISVPRLWALFQGRILEKLPPKKLDLLLAIPIINNLIKRKIQKGLGLDQTRIRGCGSAPVSPSLLRWYEKLGMPLTEAWGMSENSAYATLNYPYNSDKVGTVGRPGLGVEIKISDEGEVLCKGPGLMAGYYKEPEKTAEALQNGYLLTGDQGEKDADGYLKITGRVKDIFKTAKGKYVTPVPIEKHLATNPYMELTCVIGAGMRQPVALVHLSEASNNLSRTKLREEMSQFLQEVNKQLESHQRLQGLYIVSEPWDIEHGQLTPTLKLRRHVLEAKYHFLIDHDFKQPVIWDDEVPAPADPKAVA